MIDPITLAALGAVLLATSRKPTAAELAQLSGVGVDDDGALPFIVDGKVALSGSRGHQEPIYVVAAHPSGWESTRFGPWTYKQLTDNGVGVFNPMPRRYWPAMRITCELAAPLRPAGVLLSCGWRCPALNDALKDGPVSSSVPGSFHMTARALDFFDRNAAKAADGTWGPSAALDKMRDNAIASGQWCEIIRNQKGGYLHLARL